MKPLRLRLQAFGPYAREAVVDFRPLRSGGLFLIHGPTGAGKTSILDGICFSLFGRASGAERTPEALRSDRAAPDLATEARLEFALGAETFRVVRQPKQELARKRGEGTRTSRPEGTLEKMRAGSGDLDDGVWDLISSGDKKTDEAIVGLLGMTEEQFRQVVVLPQGQFRKFLSAGSDEREDLLERLFRTQRFRELSESMESQSRTLARHIEERRAKSSALLQAFEVSSEAELEDRLAQCHLRLAAIGTGTLELENRHRSAQEALAAARSLAKLKSEFDIVEHRRETLVKSQGTIEGHRQQLAADRRARPVAETARRVQELERDADRLAGDARGAESALVGATAASSAADALRAETALAKPESEKWVLEFRELTELLPSVRRYLKERDGGTALDATLATFKAAMTSGEASIQTLKDRRPAVEAKIEDVQTKLTRAIELSGQAERLKNEVAQHKTFVAEVSGFRELEIDLEKMRSKQSALESERAQAHEALTRMKLAYHLSQASRLAAELKPGEACPVCGSEDHPHLARPSSDHPTSEQLDAGEVRLRDLENAFSRAATELRLREIDATSLRDRISQVLGAKSADWDSSMLEREKRLRAETDPVNEAVRQAKVLRPELEALKLERDQVQKNLNTSEEALSRTRAELETSQTRMAESRTRLTELEARIPENRRDPVGIEARIHELGPRIEEFTRRERDAQMAYEKTTRDVAAAVERRQTLLEQTLKKDEDLRLARNARETELAKTDFATLAEALDAALTPKTASELEAAVRHFETEWARTDGRFRELKAELASAPKDGFDLSRFEAEFAQVDAERSQIEAERLSTLERVRRLDQAILRARDTAQDVAALESRYRTVGRLAEIAAGRPPNASRVNFQRYVLASRLDDVLDQASRRLSAMSSGRFLLKRAKNLDDKRKSAGLELAVEDAFTGTTRATASLSGGEGFLASLALALGVADVVQMHLGGIRLEAVFVDEGFGTLDPEALELAMRTLADLQAGGRMVGIISHVPELRDQIARRLSVRKTHDGSEIAWESNV